MFGVGVTDNEIKHTHVHTHIHTHSLLWKDSFLKLYKFCGYLTESSLFLNRSNWNTEVSGILTELKHHHSCYHSPSAGLISVFSVSYCDRILIGEKPSFVLSYYVTIVFAFPIMPYLRSYDSGWLVTCEFSEGFLRFVECWVSPARTVPRTLSVFSKYLLTDGLSYGIWWSLGYVVIMRCTFHKQ